MAAEGTVTRPSSARGRVLELLFPASLSPAPETESPGLQPAASLAGCGKLKPPGLSPRLYSFHFNSAF